MLVSICICTYKRPATLAQALAAVLALELPAGASLEVVVVDNDPAASARDLVQSVQAADARIAYCVETGRGVSHARNRALREARGALIGFIDDDEWCPPDWLANMRSTLEGCDADAVFGPVLARFASPPPEWMAAMGAHERPRYATGARIGWGCSRTGNVLMRRELLARIPPFDAGFATSGGEDSLFFARALDAGARLVWCDEAPVFEDVPASRVSLGWLLRRAFVGGQTFARIHAATRGAGQYAVFIVRGLAGCLVNLPLCLVFLPLNRRGAFQRARRFAGDLGKLTAITALHGGGIAAYGADSEKGRSP